MTLGGFRFDLLSRAVRERLRSESALSQRAVARASGVAPARITQLLSAQPIGVGPVLKLCRWLDRNPYDFLEDELFDAEPVKHEVSA
jgi:transcriptional regulator with XRE-family HTH domain